jgi:hypothetical protein
MCLAKNRTLIRRVYRTAELDRRGDPWMLRWGTKPAKNAALVIMPRSCFFATAAIG